MVEVMLVMYITERISLVVVQKFHLCLVVRKCKNNTIMDVIQFLVNK